MILPPKISDPPQLAVIREDECIGCTKCIQACPYDSILGASKLMHTVIADLCTGCGLCVEPCPVDCIDIIPAANKSPEDKHLFAKHANNRFAFRNLRLEKERIRDREKYLQTKQAIAANKTIDERKLEIQAILQRTKRSV